MTLSKTIQVALIGCGAVSTLYYRPALMELEKQNLLRVKALFDPNPERMAYINQYFPSAIQLKDLAGLSKHNIDLAIVASPPRYHAEQTIQFLESGISVLCEKPMATNVVQGEAMIEAAITTQQVLAIGLVRRFFPAIQTIRDVLSSGILGQVTRFYCYEGEVFNWPVQFASYFQRETSQGGVLQDIGVHLLDSLIWWWGPPIKVWYEDDAMGGIEVNCRIRLMFSPGFSGEVQLSRDWAQPNRYVIYCEKGWLSWNVNEADYVQLGLYDTDFALNAHLHHKSARWLPTIDRPGSNFEQSFVTQLTNVVAAVQGLETPLIPGEQGLESIKVIEYCYNHRSLMEMPWLSESEWKNAQQLSKEM